MGKVIMSGIVPKLVAPSTGIAASDLAVGSSVYLNENGSPVEYLVVNKGIPSNSSLYDNSCDGLWLLRKDILESRQWHSSSIGVTPYSDADIHTYLNETVLGLFDTACQDCIKQVKVPYTVYSASSSAFTTNSGSNGLSTKVFLLSGYEVGLSNVSYLPIEGDCLEYFVSGQTDAARAARVAYYSGTATEWFLRSLYTYYTSYSSTSTYAWSLGTTGYHNNRFYTYSYGIRPALILPHNALFDADTLLFKGVA